MIQAEAWHMNHKLYDRTIKILLFIHFLLLLSVELWLIFGDPTDSMCAIRANEIVLPTT